MTRLTAVSFVILKLHCYRWKFVLWQKSIAWFRSCKVWLFLAMCNVRVQYIYLFIYVSIYSFSYWEYCTCSKILSWQPTPNRQQALVKKFDATKKIFVRVEVLIFLMEREGLHNHIPLTSLVCATGWMTADSKSNCNYIKLHV